MPRRKRWTCSSIRISFWKIEVLMKNLRMTLGAVMVLGALLLPPFARAHDGPEHEIEELTQRIKEEGESADLLLQRAIEYAVIRKNAEALKDLERAVHFEPESAPILRELSRAYLASGKTNEASDTIKRAIKNAEPGAERGSAHMVQCEIRRARKD